MPRAGPSPTRGFGFLQVEHGEGVTEIVNAAVSEAELAQQRCPHVAPEVVGVEHRRAVASSALSTSASPADVSTTRALPLFGVVMRPPVKFRSDEDAPVVKVEVAPLERHRLAESEPGSRERQDERVEPAPRVSPPELRAPIAARREHG